jgi:hypothetical protein
VSLSLLDKEAEVEDTRKKSRDLCVTVEADVKDIMRYDLERVNEKYAAKIAALRERFLQ